MVTIGITTHNGLDTVKKMAASLYQSELSAPHHIRVYDAGSTEYTAKDLQAIFPTAASVTRNVTNARAGQNVWRMYRDFISQSDDEYFFNADSDLLFHTGWLVKALELIQKTDGILSVFNCPAKYPTKTIIDEVFCTKEHVSAAGTLFARKRMEEILCAFPEETSEFDRKWCAFFVEQGVSMYCTNKSLVQHIGYGGQNARNFSFDVGKGFEIDSLYNAQVINDRLESCIWWAQTGYGDSLVSRSKGGSR
ncbi:MAG: glycosyltransferase family 2 protein [Spirochaetaceae bacterium]|jgi:glycosyltransferase involved in cell wall biosynthesis|nr:glycosyltransferase family 2 protein [Spirochaetaceae bacterium]